MNRLPPSRAPNFHSRPFHISLPFLDELGNSGMEKEILYMYLYINTSFTSTESFPFKNGGKKEVIV
jgi:hypothetical protein